VGRHSILFPPVWKSVGHTSPVSPTKLRPWLLPIGPHAKGLRATPCTSLANLQFQSKHEVSSASTSKSIAEVEEETTPGRIRNNEGADVESNIIKAYAAKVGNDDKTILRNDMSCSSVFFNLFAAAEPSANVCIAHETWCNGLSVHIATTAQNCGCEFRLRQFQSVSAEPSGTLRFCEPRMKNTDVASCPGPINHNIIVEFKAGPERYRIKMDLSNRWFELQT